MKFSIIAHPNAKQPRIEKDLLGDWHVYVSQPPLDGQANKAIEEAVAMYFKVKKGEARIVSGFKGKKKLVEIEDFSTA